MATKYKTLNRTIEKDNSSYNVSKNYKALYNIFDENDIFIGTILEDFFQELLELNIIKEEL